MALVRVELSLAERHLCNVFLNDLPKVNLEVAENVREIYRTFELREVSRKIRKLSEDSENVTWDDLIEFSERKENSPRTFTLDGSYIIWLRKALEEKEWNIVIGFNRNGEKFERPVTLSVEQIITIAVP